MGFNRISFAPFRTTSKLKVNIEIKIKMDNGKDVILNHDETKELLSKLKEIFPEPVYFPQPINPVIVEPYRWWERVWYSSSGTLSITNVAE
jgi:hypothetical protein